MAESTPRKPAAKPANARRPRAARAKSAIEGLENSPLAVLVGGLAVGALAGALIPRSDRERQVMRPLGKRLAEGAGAAIAAAKETGREQLNSAMLNRDTAKEGARKVLASAVKAARAKKEPA